VPNPPQTLARFVRAFRERVGPDQRPICVHCSAGVGRSGTFITLDRILQQIQVLDYVDIFGIVWAMRKGKIELFFLFRSYRTDKTRFSQNVYGWFKPNNNTFVSINAC
jgi:protein tyrosine phosphatase